MLLLLAICGVALGGCHPPTPARVLDEYLDHLAHGRVAAAYALTTPAYRARHDLAAFALSAARQPLVDRGERRTATQEIVVELASGAEPPVLVVGPSRQRLRLAHDPLDLYPATTPEAALRSFARAVRLGLSERARALLAPPLRDRVRAAGPLPESLVTTARRIECSLEGAAPILMDGARARWLSGEAAAISLERIGPGWVLTTLD